MPKKSKRVQLKTHEQWMAERQAWADANRQAGWSVLTKDWCKRIQANAIASYKSKLKAK